MKHRVFAAASALYLAAHAPSFADKTTQGAVVTLDSIGDRISARNPDLAAARFRIGEAEGRHVQSGRLSNPELTLEASQDPRFRERGLEVGFSQRFPVTHRLQLEKIVSATLIEAARAEVREVERRLVTEARQGVVKVLALRQRQALVERQIALSGEFVRFLSDAASRGEGSPLDAGQAKIEATSLALEQRQLAAAEVAEIGHLKPLLGVRPDEPLYVTGVLSETASMPKAIVNPGRRPDYQAAILNARAARESIEVEKSKKYDDVEAGFFAGANRSEDAPEGYRTEGIVGLRFSIPLPLWNRNEGGVMEAQAKTARLEKEAEALDGTIRLEAQAAKGEMREWQKLLTELREELLPAVEEQTTAAEEAFKSGQGDIQTVFRAREKRAQLAGAKLDALREFHLARVRYESALNQP